MEPTLTPPDPDDHLLEELLCTAPPPIPDDGFTARVCAALPPSTTNVPPPLRLTVLAGSACLGCVLVWLIERQANPDWLRSIIDVLLTWRIQPWSALTIAGVFAIWGIVGLDREDRWQSGNAV